MSRVLHQLRSEWLVWLAAALLVAGLAATNPKRGLARLDAWIHDRFVSLLEPAADPLPLIVAIDQASFAELGRWPWPRRVHAALLDRLAAQGSGAVAFDISFSEPDPADPEGDALLAGAVARHGRVVLPVMVEPSEAGGVPVEVLPLPELVAAAAALGHATVDLHPDGVARHTCLRGGLGGAVWPSLGRALSELAEGRPSAPLNVVAGPSPFVWEHAECVRIAWLPMHRFEQVGYADVLNGRVPPALLRDRVLLVGVSATGLGERVPTPLSGEAGLMHGVFYHANVAEALYRGRVVRDVPTLAQRALTLLPVLLVLGLLPWPASRSGRALAIAMPVFVVLACLGLLALAGLWFAPAVALAGTASALALLGLRSVHIARSLAYTDALTGLANRRRFDLVLAKEMAACRRSRRPLSLLLIDVDHFKAYNDRHGHRAGDELLRRIAAELARVSRRGQDLAARYGGDELAVVVPGMGASGARALSQRILLAVRRLGLADASLVAGRGVSLSIGSATAASGDCSTADLIESADIALYRAKRAGRDVCMHVDAGTADAAAGVASGSTGPAPD